MKDQKDYKILIADDEPDILEFVTYNLIKEGYQVSTARNGMEAVEKGQGSTTSPYFARYYDAWARRGRGLPRIA